MRYLQVVLVIADVAGRDQRVTVRALGGDLDGGVGGGGGRRSGGRRIIPHHSDQLRLLAEHILDVAFMARDHHQVAQRLPGA